MDEACELSECTTWLHKIQSPEEIGSKSAHKCLSTTTTYITTYFQYSLSLHNTRTVNALITPKPISTFLLCVFVCVV